MKASQYVPIHSKQIRGLSFNRQNDSLLLSAALDNTIKLTRYTHKHTHTQMYSLLIIDFQIWLHSKVVMDSRLALLSRDMSEGEYFEGTSGDISDFPHLLWSTNWTRRTAYINLPHKLLNSLVKEPFWGTTSAVFPPEVTSAAIRNAARPANQPVIEGVLLPPSYSDGVFWTWGLEPLAALHAWPTQTKSPINHTNTHWLHLIGWNQLACCLLRDLKPDQHRDSFLNFPLKKIIN